MEHSRLRKPPLSQGEDARPRDPAFLAPAAKGTPPERKHPIPKHTQTREVSWHRVVVKVALDHPAMPVWAGSEFPASKETSPACPVTKPNGFVTKNSLF